jgi:hypothetical protein
MTLRIETDKFYTQGGVLAPWYSDEKDKFEPRVKAALEQIRSTEVESSLLRAIEGAGQQVLIVSAPQILDNKCAQADKGEQACKAACYAEVLDVGLLDKKFKQLKEEGKVTANHPGWKEYKKFYFKKDLKSTLTEFSRDIPSSGIFRVWVANLLCACVPLRGTRNIKARRERPGCASSALYRRALECAV